MKAMNWIKRIVCALLVCTMLIANAVPALAAYTPVSRSDTLAHTGDVYYVVASGLHVRTTASMSDNIKTSIGRGTKVVFRYEQNGWWYIKYGNGRYGFVDKKYLTRYNVRKTGSYKTTTALNVRNYPRTSAHKLGGLKKGAKIRVLSLNGDWCRINYLGYEGWVASKYLKKV